MPRGPGAPRVRKNGRWHGRWRGCGCGRGRRRGRGRSLGFVARMQCMQRFRRVCNVPWGGGCGQSVALLHAKLPNLARTGALANVSAELEKLGAKIEAVEKEISDTEVELRTAKENNNQGEVRRLHDEKKQLREKEKQLRDKEILLLERALPAPGVPSIFHSLPGPRC